jgi:hypothetical protein
VLGPAVPTTLVDISLHPPRLRCKVVLHVIPSGTVARAYALEVKFAGDARVSGDVFDGVFWETAGIRGAVCAGVDFDFGAGKGRSLADVECDWIDVAL